MRIPRRSRRNRSWSTGYLLGIVLVAGLILAGAFLYDSLDLGAQLESANSGETLLQVVDVADDYDTTAIYEEMAERVPVTFVRHFDGDTSVFLLDGEEVTVRYLGIDTEEIRGSRATEQGHRASQFVYERLTMATAIELEFDPNRDYYCSWGRPLAWVWVDDVLLQEELIREGLAVIAFTTGNEVHYQRLRNAESILD